MSRPFKYGPSEPEDDAAPEPERDDYVSEFISEKALPFRPPAPRVTPPAGQLPAVDAPAPDTAAAAPPEPFGPAALPAPPLAAPAPALTGPQTTLPPAPGDASPVTHITRAPRRIPWLWVLLITALFAGGAVYYRMQLMERTSAAATAAAPRVPEGAATIISRPEGAEVYIDGTLRGVSPLRLTLPVGTYALELRNGGATRSLQLTIDAGTAVRELVDLAPAPVAAESGRLDVTTDVPGARVTVDGIPRGVTPLSLAGIAPGAHRVVVGTGDAAVYRTVTVASGATASVMASIVPAGSSGGWLEIQAPFEVQVMHAGRVIGTSGAERLMLPAGPYELQLVAPEYEFRITVNTTIDVGQTVTIPVTVPNGVISINALPWAEVWIDDRPVGATPIGNLSVPIGSREVRWRHPQLGERRQTVRVTAGTPVRVGVDLNSR